MSSSIRKKAILEYKKLVRDTSYQGFRIFDVNGDGIKEMLLTFDSDLDNVDNFDVCTFKNGKVVCCDKTEYVNFGLKYNKSTKKLIYSWGGSGSSYYAYYGLTKSCKLKKYDYLETKEAGFKNGFMRYKYYFKGKKITSKKYKSIYMNFIKNLKSLKFYKLTYKNLDKYMK